MTSLSKDNEGRFRALRDECTKALKKVAAEYNAAVKSGDAAAQAALEARRSELYRTFGQVDAAEAAWIRSGLSVAQAENILKRELGRARDATGAMTDLAETLNRSAVVVRIMAGLVNLFA